MRISRESLERVAATTGFRAEILEKVIHLFSLLDGFQKHPFLKGKWVLKGGTALNLFWFDVPRLSVDIDLNYVGQVEREAMLAERPKIEVAIQAVCAREGFTVARVPSGHAGGKWRLSVACGGCDHANKLAPASARAIARAFPNLGRPSPVKAVVPRSPGAAKKPARSATASALVPVSDARPHRLRGNVSSKISPLGSPGSPALFWMSDAIPDRVREAPEFEEINAKSHATYETYDVGSSHRIAT
jgi:hypothetical protein